MPRCTQEIHLSPTSIARRKFVKNQHGINRQPMHCVILNFLLFTIEVENNWEAENLTWPKVISSTFYFFSPLNRSGWAEEFHCGVGINYTHGCLPPGCLIFAYAKCFTTKVPLGLVEDCWERNLRHEKKKSFAIWWMESVSRVTLERKLLRLQRACSVNHNFKIILKSFKAKVKFDWKFAELSLCNIVDKRLGNYLKDF